jgi:glycosyltransferase involved in cell wall biosynthesis
VAAGRNSGRVEVLYAAVGSLGRDYANTNLGQRVVLAPDTVALEVLVPRHAELPPEVPAHVRVRRARLPTLAGLYLALLGSLAIRGGSVEVLITDRSAASIIGWALRPLRGYRWVVDLWDVPHKELITDYAARRGLRAVVRRAASRLKVSVLSGALRRADLVLASVLPGALARYRLDPSRLRLFENAIDLRGAPPEDDGRERDGICYVTSIFLPDRGLRTLVRAVELLATRGLEPRVTLVGRVPDEEARHIEQSPAREQFALAGPRGIAEAHDVMRGAQIGVVPFDANEDLDYTFPIKLYEYMQLGCVAVASDLPGIRRILGPDGGVLTEPGSPEDLARAIEELLGDPGSRARLQAAARERVQRFDAAEKTRQIYAAVVDGGN